jgi:hypothetical protein
MSGPIWNIGRVSVMNFDYLPRSFIKAYDIFASLSIHGELICLICGSNTDCLRLTHGGKISYFDWHRCWLPRKDNTITNGLPKRLSGSQIVDTLDKSTPDPERPAYFKGYRETHN